jgi:hypothetical protein
MSTMTIRFVVSHFTVLARAGMVEIAEVGEGIAVPPAGYVVCIAAVWIAPLQAYVAA